MLFVFPGHRTSAWPPAPAPDPGSQFVFTDSGHQFVLTDPGSKFLFIDPGQSRTWACIYQLCPANLYLLALAYDYYYRALYLHLPSYL